MAKAEGCLSSGLQLDESPPCSFKATSRTTEISASLINDAAPQFLHTDFTPCPLNWNMR
jgi:hypothetical protein